MAGISSKALKFPYPDNKNGYNGNELQTKEFSDGGGLELYDFNARTYDQQIGRFIQIDPEFENFDQESLSPYHFAKNDPIHYNDPTGRCPDCPGFVAPAIPFILEGLATLIDAAIVFFASNETGKQISKVANSPNPQAALTSFDMNVGSNLGVPTGSTFRKLYAKGDVPNPDGKKGGADHRATIDNEESKMRKEGFDVIEKEVMVRTPEGEKTKRFIDLQGTNSKTGEVKQVQVGKQNKDGTPVSREKKALNDIEKASNKRPEFVPYNILNPFNLINK